MREVRAAVCGMAFCLMAISPASAVAIDLGVIKIDVGAGRGVGGGAGNGRGGKGYGVPGPIAGAGLPVLAAYGGYVWLRKRTRRNKG